MVSKIDPGIWWKMGEWGLTPEEKVAFLWAFSHEAVNQAGCFTWNARRFETECGLPLATWESLCSKVGNRIVRVGALVWLRGYIEHNLGRGTALAKNRISGSIRRWMTGAPKEIVDQITDEYSELAIPMPSPSDGHAIPMPSTCHPHQNGQELGVIPQNDPHAIPMPSPCHGVGEGEGEGEGVGGVGGIPTLEEVLTMATMRGVPEAFARDYFERTSIAHGWIRNGRLIEWPRDLQFRFRTYGQSFKTPAAAGHRSELEALEAALEAAPKPSEQASDLARKIRELKSRMPR